MVSEMCKYLILSKVRSKCSRQNGALLVELALTFPVFVVLVVFGLHLILLMNQVTSLQNATSRAARWASLGAAWPPGVTQGSDPSGVESLRKKIEELSGLPVDPATFQVCPSDHVSTPCASNSRGGPNDVIYIHARVNAPFLLYKAAISASEIVRNEPLWSLKAESSLQIITTEFTVGSDTRELETF